MERYPDFLRERPMSRNAESYTGRAAARPPYEQSVVTAMEPVERMRLFIVSLPNKE